MFRRGKPLLVTEAEAAEYIGTTVDVFRKFKLNPVGSYTPPRSKSIPLFAMKEVEKFA